VSRIGAVHAVVTLACVNPVARLRASSRGPLLQVVKTAVAVVAAVLLGRLVFPDTPFPTFAAIAALLVVQPSINQSFVRGLERSAGVVMGVILATVGHLVLGDATWVVLLVIVVAILVAWALRLTPTSATQVAISGMLVLTTGIVTPNYSVDRILETVMGAAVALVVNALIVPPVLLRPAHLAVARLARDVSAAFERIVIGLTEGHDEAAWHESLLAARQLRGTLAKSDAAMTAARESLTMNPRGGRNRDILEADIEVAGHLSVLVTRAIGMTRAIRDNATPDLYEDPTVHRIATEVARIATDVRRLADTSGIGAASAGAASGGAAAGSAGFGGGGSGGAASGRGASVEDALTTPVTVVRPNERHWILIGSLLEDIRRIREELLGEGA
jgi:uncharacterized membrane protein YgaE (UPF0421/DUF939 family)